MTPINVAIITDHIDTKNKQMLIRKFNRFLDHIPGDLHARYACQIIYDCYIKNEMEKTQYTEIEAGPRTMLNVLWNDLKYIDNHIDVVIFGPVSDTEPSLRLYLDTISYATPTLLWPFHSIVEEDSSIISFLFCVVSRNRMHYLLEDRKLPKFSDDVIRTILNYDQWDVLKGYVGVDGQSTLTGKQKLLETNLLLRILRALITDKKRDDEQFLNLAKYGTVLRYGVRFGVDYKSAREDLGIEELKARYRV